MSEKPTKKNLLPFFIGLFAIIIFTMILWVQSEKGRKASLKEHDRKTTAKFAGIPDTTKPDIINYSEPVTTYTAPLREDPYEMIRVVFVNNPEQGAVQPMMERVLEKYSMDVSDENITRVASMLLELRKTSAVGVTEMDLLKHIYQNGSSLTTLPEQAALSSVLLEHSK